MKFTVALSRRKVVSIIFVLMLAAGSFYAGAQYAMAQSGVLTAQNLDGGVYPGAPSYTVWGEGGYYYAKNAYGAISFTSTNASYTINSALATSGNVLLKNGVYDITNSCVVYSNTIFEGEGVGTILRATGSLSNMICQAGYVDVDTFGTAANYVTIKNFAFDGNGIADRGIQAKINYVHIENNVFYDVLGYAVKMVRSSNVWITGNTLLSSEADGFDVLWCGQGTIANNKAIGNISDNAIAVVHSYDFHVTGNYIDKSSYGIGSALGVWGGNDNIISENIVTGSPLHGIIVYDYEAEYPIRTSVINNVVKDNDQKGIDVVGTTGTDAIKYVNIEGNHVFLNGRQGIYVLNSGYGSIKNNLIYDNGYAANNTYSQIILDASASGNCTHWIIEGNILTSSQTNRPNFNIYVPSSNPCYVLISNNQCSGVAGTLFDNIVKNDATTKAYNNYYETTWYATS